MSSHRNKPDWNITSLFFTGIGVLLAIPCYFGFGPVFGTIFGIYVFLFFAALGVLFAVLSLVRRERLLIISLLGLIVNGLPWIWWAMNYVKQPYRL